MKEFINYMINKFNGNQEQNINEYSIKDIVIKTNTKKETVEIAKYNEHWNRAGKFEKYEETKHKSIVKWLGYKFDN